MPRECDRALLPQGEEGIAGVRVPEGSLSAQKSGGSIELEPFERRKRIDPDVQERTLGARRSPELAGVSNPGRDVDKILKN